MANALGRNSKPNFCNGITGIHPRTGDGMISSIDFNLRYWTVSIVLYLPDGKAVAVAANS